MGQGVREGLDVIYMGVCPERRVSMEDLQDQINPTHLGCD